MENTESRALQEAQGKAAEGVRAVFLQFSKGNILDLSLEDVTNVHVLKGRKTPGRLDDPIRVQEQDHGVKTNVKWK